MCLAVFVWKAHPVYPFLLLLNRDEYHNRSTLPLAWWDWDDHPRQTQILGGRDGLAGGTWLASAKNGRLAFLTNVRELPSTSQDQLKSRGHLPVRFLQSKKSPKDFAYELMEEGDKYNGFNLIVADLSSMAMVYITNRSEGSGIVVMQVTPGVHVLSNAKLDTPWPKALRLEQSFKQVLDKYGAMEIPLKEVSEKLMSDTTKYDESKLPGIYHPEFEYQLSSIFVDCETSTGRYGTRSSSIVAMEASGNITFYERYLHNDSWKEQSISFVIEKEKDNTVA